MIEFQCLSRIFMVPTEPSSDALGAACLSRFFERSPDLKVFGMAGPQMRAQCSTFEFDISELSIMGFSKILCALPRLLRLRQKMLSSVQSVGADLYFAIDGPDWNLRMAERLKSLGLRTCMLNSPTVWAWRPNRKYKIAKVLDQLLCLFPFEPACYEGLDLDVRYVGHPMADEILLSVDREREKKEARTRLGIPLDRPVLACLPGSRTQELEQHGVLFVEAAQQAQQACPGTYVVSHLVSDSHVQAWSRMAGPTMDMRTGGVVREVLKAADVALLASGTITLEAMLIGVPMVVTYRTDPFSAWIARRLLKTPYVALPNILAGELLVPELLQEAATPSNLSQAVVPWLKGRDASALLGLFQRMHQTLRCGATSRIADAILSHGT